MDPQATFSELFEALKNSDHETIQDSAGALAEWMQKGGFAPTIEFNALAEFFGALADYAYDQTERANRSGR